MIAYQSKLKAINSSVVDTTEAKPSPADANAVRAKQLGPKAMHAITVDVIGLNLHD
jgi:hypothetical protein